MSTNVNAPFGLQLVEDNSLTPLELCIIDSGDGTATFVGDAVKTAGDAKSITGNPIRKTVIQCAAGDPIYGVVQGFLPQMTGPGQSMDLGIRYRKASTSMYVLVKPANYQDIYRTQSDDVGTLIDSTYVGLNANLTVGSGSTVTGMSAMQLDSSTSQTTATLQLKIIDQDADRSFPGVANQTLLVRLNNIELGGGTGTLGV